MADETRAIRMCFYCANTHNFTERKCKCACHKVQGLWDRLRAIDSETDWTIPQLIAVQKLMGEYKPKALADANSGEPSAPQSGLPQKGG